MTALTSIISNDLVLVIGQTILNSLWQGAAVGLLCWFILGLVKKENSYTRYWIHLSGILSVVVLAVITFGSLYSSHLNAISGTNTIYPSSEFANLTIGNQLTENPDSFTDTISWILPYISVLWFFGTLFFSFRLLGGLLYINRLRSQATPIISDDLKALASRISKKLNLNKLFELGESAKISAPIIIGHIKPILLFPVGALAGLPITQVEAIISHELAHIKRNDYLLNLLFSIVEVLFFFNPAVWWMNAQIKINREILCDDLALEVTGDPANYAKALSSMQEIANGNFQLATAFSGNKEQLLNRIQRIYNNTHMKSKIRKTNSLAALFIMASLVVLFSTCIQPMNPSGTADETIELMPKADTKEDLADDATVDEITISIDKNLDFYIDTSPIESSSLESALKVKFDGVPEEERSIALSTETSVPISEVIKVMNIAKNNNYRLILATKAK